MKAAGLALLAALGCNQIFGIDKTQAWDAHAPFDAPDWTTAITWQTLQDNGQITADPIAGLAVAIAPLDGMSMPTPVQIDAAGNFKVPYGLAFAPYRVVFMAPDGIPTEIQTKLQGFAYGFPIYGRHTRGSVAAGATFSGTVTGAITADAAHLLTTGLWSVTDVASGAAAFSFPYQTGAVSLSGPLGVPAGSDGDAEIVLYSDAGSGAGFAVFDADGLGSAGSAAIQSNSTSVSWTKGTISSAGTRLSSAIGGLPGATTSDTARVVGAIPTTMMPNFVQPLTAATASSASAPAAVLLPLDSSGAASVEIQNPFATGTGAPTLPLAVYAGDFRTRAVTGSGSGSVQTYLTTSLQSITPATATTVVDYAAGLAMSLPGMAMTFNGADLTTEPVAVTIGGSKQLPLMFGADAPVDDCTVTLFRIENGTGSLTPIARYIVTDTPAHAQSAILVDASFLDTSSVFSFGIHCETGHATSTNDFTQVTYPFSASTTFTAAFTAQ